MDGIHLGTKTAEQVAHPSTEFPREHLLCSDVRHGSPSSRQRSTLTQPWASPLLTPQPISLSGQAFSQSPKLPLLELTCASSQSLDLGLVTVQKCFSSKTLISKSPKLSHLRPSLVTSLFPWLISLLTFPQPICWPPHVSQAP